MRFFPFLKKTPTDSHMDSHIARHDEGTESVPSSKYDLSNVIGGLAWYRLQYEKVLKLVSILILTILVSVALNIILFLNHPAPIYYAATPDLRLAPLVPLSKPLLTEQGLLNWCAETVTQAISLDFLEWRSKLSKSRQHFAPKAFKSFLESLQRSGVLDMVKEKRLSVSASISQAPVITTSGIVKGVATWRIEFPLIVSYESSQGVESSQNLLASVLVRRANTAKTPRGVVIEQVILKRGK